MDSAATKPRPMAACRSVLLGVETEGQLTRERCDAAVADGLDAGVTSLGIEIGGSEVPGDMNAAPDDEWRACGEPPSNAPNGNGRGAKRACMYSPRPAWVARSRRSRANCSKSAANAPALA